MKRLNIKHKGFGLLVVIVCFCAIIPLFHFMNHKIRYTFEKDAFWYTLNTQIPVKEGTVFSYENEQTISDSLDVLGLPLYFYDEEKIVLPKNYSLIYSDGSMYKANHFSEIYRKDYHYYLEYENESFSLEDCFLFDGLNTYILLQEVELKIGDMIYQLNPFSCVSVYKDGQFEIYDYKQDYYNSGKEDSLEISFILKDGYSIDMINDVLIQPDQQILLFFKPETLPNKS